MSLWYDMNKSYHKEVQQYAAGKYEIEQIFGGVDDILNKIEALPEENRNLLKRIIRSNDTGHSIRLKRDEAIQKLIDLGYFVDVTDNEAIINSEYDKNALFREISKHGYDFKVNSTTTKKEMVEYLKNNERAIKNLANKYIEVTYSERFCPYIKTVREVFGENEQGNYDSLGGCYNEIENRKKEREKNRVRTSTHVIELRLPEENSTNYDRTTERNQDLDETVKQMMNEYKNTPSKKKKKTALLLCIFGGYFGLHYFYVGKIGMGILYLCTVGIFGIGWIIDIIKVTAGKFKDKYGHCLK